jgi:hypothetical protein
MYLSFKKLLLKPRIFLFKHDNQAQVILFFGELHDHMRLFVDIWNMGFFYNNEWDYKKIEHT